MIKNNFLKCFFGTLSLCLLLKRANKNINKLALQMGIKNRFAHMSRDPKLITAATLLSKFHTTSTKDEVITKTGKTSGG